MYFIIRLKFHAQSIRQIILKNDKAYLSGYRVKNAQFAWFLGYERMPNVRFERRIPSALWN